MVDAPVLESPVRAADLHRGRLRLRRHGGGRGCRRRRLRSPSKELFDDAEEAAAGLRITNFIYPPEVAEAIEAAREEKAQLARAAVDDVRKREHQPWRFDRRWRSGADRLWAWFCDGERWL